MHQVHNYFFFLVFSKIPFLCFYFYFSLFSNLKCKSIYFSCSKSFPFLKQTIRFYVHSKSRNASHFFLFRQCCNTQIFRRLVEIVCLWIEWSYWNIVFTALFSSRVCLFFIRQKTICVNVHLFECFKSLMFRA